jgi:hypothetical protein
VRIEGRAIENLVSRSVDFGSRSVQAFVGAAVERRVAGAVGSGYIDWAVRFAVCFASFVLCACPDPVVPAPMCPDDPRADAYASSLERTSESGRFTVTLEAPRAPATGENAWTAVIVDRDAEPFTARMRAWMPDEEIGTTPLFHDVRAAGLWEFRFELVTASAIERVQFAFCVVPGVGFDGGTDAGRADAGDAAVDAAGDAAPMLPDAGPCDVVAPTECRDPTLVYSDVAPIFNLRCAETCHNGSDKEWPLRTYTHVHDWRDDIRSRMLDCSMPPPASGYTMSLAERATILDWIRCGLPM